MLRQAWWSRIAPAQVPQTSYRRGWLRTEDVERVVAPTELVAGSPLLEAGSTAHTPPYGKLVTLAWPTPQLLCKVKYYEVPWVASKPTTREHFRSPRTAPSRFLSCGREAYSTSRAKHLDGRGYSQLYASVCAAPAALRGRDQEREGARRRQGRPRRDRPAQAAVRSNPLSPRTRSGSRNAPSHDSKLFAGLIADSLPSEHPRPGALDPTNHVRVDQQAPEGVDEHHVDGC